MFDEKSLIDWIMFGERSLIDRIGNDWREGLIDRIDNV